MFCSAIEINYAFSNTDFKLEYSGISIDEVLAGAKIAYYTPQTGFINSAAQKIADHIWQAMRQAGETNHIVYITLYTVVNPNGSIFAKIRVYVHNRSQSFGAKQTHIFINRYAPAANFIDNIPWKLTGKNCGVPEDFQGKSPKQIMSSTGQRPTIVNP